MKIPRILVALSIVVSSTVGAEIYFSPKSLFETAKSYEQTDQVKAISLYKNSAEGGYLPAQALLAGMYRFGIGGVKTSCKAAIYWYERAEEQGSLEASTDLAGTYADEDSECFSQKKSIALYKESAEKGSGEAQHELARLYLQGRGVPKNIVAAYAWLSTSMRAGNYQRALRLRDSVEAGMTAKQIDEAKELARSYIKNYVKD